MLIQQVLWKAQLHTHLSGRKNLIPNKNMFVRCSFFEAHIKKRCNLCAKQPLPVFHTSADTIDRFSQQRTSNHYSLRLNKVYPLIEPYVTQNTQKEQHATNTWEHSSSHNNSRSQTPGQKRRRTYPGCLWDGARSWYHLREDKEREIRRGNQYFSLLFVFDYGTIQTTPWWDLELLSLLHHRPFNMKLTTVKIYLKINALDIMIQHA